MNVNSSRIFLDYAATWPLREPVREAMLPWLGAGNPSSLHAEGRKVRAMVDTARERVSQALGCGFGECIFTSGATESANLAIIGRALANTDASRTRILLSAGEHHCVLNTETILRRLGYDVEVLPIDREGRLNTSALAERLDETVLLVAAMHGNNETGAISDVTQVRELTANVGATYFCDAVQSFRKPPFEAARGQADLMSVSAHKLGGPPGIGVLMIRAGTKIKPLIAGGGQERELRGGTENVAGIVGFGAAVTLTYDHDATRASRDAFLAGLDGVAVATVVNGPGLESHAHVRFPGISTETLLIRLDRAGVSASGGSACSSGSIESSHVLVAAGWTDAEARSCVRFTFSPEVSVESAKEAAGRVVEAVAAMKQAQASRA